MTRTMPIWADFLKTNFMMCSTASPRKWFTIVWRHSCLLCRYIVPLLKELLDRDTEEIGGSKTRKYTISTIALTWWSCLKSNWPFYFASSTTVCRLSGSRFSILMFQGSLNCLEVLVFALLCWIFHQVDGVILGLIAQRVSQIMELGGIRRWAQNCCKGGQLCTVSNYLSIRRASCSAMHSARC